MDFTVTAAVPLETRVMVFDPWEPTVMSPKSTLLGAESDTVCGAAAPVPVRLIVLGLPLALSASAICPCWLPAADGANVRGSTTCWPGASVSGQGSFRAENEAPLTVSDCRTTTAVPLEVNVTELAPCEPTVTEPKLTAVVLNVRAGVD